MKPDLEILLNSEIKPAEEYTLKELKLLMEATLEAEYYENHSESEKRTFILEKGKQAEKIMLTIGLVDNDGCFYCEYENKKFQKLVDWFELHYS